MRHGQRSSGTVSERLGAGNCLAPKSRASKPALVRLACARLADLTRLWLLREAPLDAHAPANAPLAARYVVSATIDAWRCAAAVGEQSPPPGLQLECVDWRDVLTKLAALHAGEQLALNAPASLLERVAREALALPGFVLDIRAQNVVVDWPARSAEHLRCAFIGVDLDWSPPPPPKSAARFPGGPGSAATSRT